MFKYSWYDSIKLALRKDFSVESYHEFIILNFLKIDSQSICPENPKLDRFKESEF
jgi:hypothetical protein